LLPWEDGVLAADDAAARVTRLDDEVGTVNGADFLV
jgi:hypothetical protein